MQDEAAVNVANLTTLLAHSRAKIAEHTRRRDHYRREATRGTVGTDQLTNILHAEREAHVVHAYASVLGILGVLTTCPCGRCPATPARALDNPTAG